jgi:hypothetical protein
VQLGTSRVVYIVLESRACTQAVHAGRALLLAAAATAATAATEAAIAARHQP